MDKGWDRLLGMITKSGSKTYTELMGMDIEDFYIAMINYEEDLKRQNNGRKTGFNSSK